MNREPVTGKGATGTALTTVSRAPAAHFGFVNPPVYRGSTVLFESFDEMAPGAAPYHYGRWGTPTTDALCDAMTEIEHGVAALVMCSGLATIATVLQTLAAPEGRVLISRSSYPAARKFCDEVLHRHGVSIDEFSLDDLAELAAKLDERTCVVYLDLPGSSHFDMCVLRDVVEIAGPVPVVVDNTWGTPYFFNPLDHGASIAIHSMSKYIGGHADSMVGAAVFASVDMYERVKSVSRLTGQAVGADDANLALRGLRTLAIRMDRHFQSACDVASWLRDHPLIESVHYPPLVGDSGHAAWRTQYSGAGGVFACVLKDGGEGVVRNAIDGLALIGRGWGWGGYESVACPTMVSRDNAKRIGIRLSIGLEDPDTLRQDLDVALRTGHR
ncbi:Cystathionine beta-lyase [Burkholderia lata]|uniref:trans-sulfuration enzyme family protein n=1 Tax=Burkholderia lata (strain ATCC 17760 / DSM 23089 / LMG 22485 / NCIMB 9086 / R18194 / 383) TaxID=482957 RepID=UPI0014532F72|nr:PLP-dependent aspartate aminotransferase family protein [Burkholderia lata]VWC12893.1 Cystathionine beta-lyase [Burkholderia lata]